MRKRAHRVFRIIKLLWISAGLLFVASLVLSSRASKSARIALISDGRVTVVDTGPVIAFRPAARLQTTGLIFYTGAMVEPAAYAPLCRWIAESRYPVFVVKLPLRSAPRRSHVDRLFRQTEETMRRNPAIKKWVVSGHSRGGALAVRFGKSRGKDVSGLLLIATSPPKDSGQELSQATYPVLKIYGSNDGLASEAEVTGNRQYLPANSLLYRVEGGNHAHIGDYGWQLGDSKANIGRPRQQSLTLGAILRFLEDLRQGQGISRSEASRSGLLARNGISVSNHGKLGAVSNLERAGRPVRPAQEPVAGAGRRWPGRTTGA